jgi:hypothetical protein
MANPWSREASFSAMSVLTTSALRYRPLATSASPVRKAASKLVHRLRVSPR